MGTRDKKRSDGEKAMQAAVGLFAVATGGPIGAILGGIMVKDALDEKD